MSGLTDALVGGGVVIIFFYLMLMRMMKKIPGMRDSLSAFFPYLKKEEPYIPQQEETKQVWQEKRTII